MENGVCELHILKAKTGTEKNWDICGRNNEGTDRNRDKSWVFARLQVSSWFLCLAPRRDGFLDSATV